MSLRAVSDKLGSTTNTPRGAVARTFEGSGGGASVLLLPGRLTLASNCAGKFKASITPVPRTVARRAPSRAGVVELDKAQKVVDKHERFYKRSAGILNSREEFAVATWAPPLATERGRAGYGGACKPYKFTRRAAEQIQEACVILEERYGKNAVFLTFTLPTQSAIAAQVISEWSGWLVKNVRQWVRDKMQCKHAVVGVWEWQKRGALHLHLAVAGESVVALGVLVREARRMWSSLLVTLTRRTGVNLFSALSHDARGSVLSWRPAGPAIQVDAEFIKKSLARYLSKYTSKVKQVGARAALFFPSRWWTCDRETLREAKARRIHLSLEGFDLAAWRLPLSEIITNAVASCAQAFVNSNPQFPALPVVVGLVEPGRAEGLVIHALQIVEKFDRAVQNSVLLLSRTKRGSINNGGINAVAEIASEAAAKVNQRSGGDRRLSGEHATGGADSNRVKGKRWRWFVPVRDVRSTAGGGGENGKIAEYQSNESVSDCDGGPGRLQGSSKQVLYG